MEEEEQEEEEKEEGSEEEEEETKELDFIRLVTCVCACEAKTASCARAIWTLAREFVSVSARTCASSSFHETSQTMLASACALASTNARNYVRDGIFVYFFVF